MQSNTQGAQGRRPSTTIPLRTIIYIYENLLTPTEKQDLAEWEVEHFLNGNKGLLDWPGWREHISNLDEVEHNP